MSLYVCVSVLKTVRAFCAPFFFSVQFFNAALYSKFIKAAKALLASLSLSLSLSLLFFCFLAVHALNSIVPGRQAGRSPLPNAQNQNQNPVTGSASAEVPRTGNFGLGLVFFFFWGPCAKSFLGCCCSRSACGICVFWMGGLRF